MTRSHYDIGANLVNFLVERSIIYLSSEVSFTELPVKKGKGSEDRRIIAACVKVVFLVVRWSPVLLFKMGWLQRLTPDNQRKQKLKALSISFLSVELFHNLSRQYYIKKFLYLCSERTADY